MECGGWLAIVVYAILVLYLCRLIYSIYNVIYPFLIASPIKDLVAFSGGQWAVITGSTDGIGKAYAFELARKGFNIVLISRTPQRLESVKKEIETEVPNCQVKTIAYCFTNPNANDYREKIVQQLKGIDVGLLVNNVGMSHEHPDRLADMEGGLERLSNILVVNTVPTTLMTAIVLPQMIERKKGVIINISSGSSYNPMALWSVYIPTKKYVDWFTTCVRLEYSAKESGITIQTVNPFFVMTKMSKISKTSFFTPGPEYYARCAVNTIGISDETNGCLAHQIQGEFARLGPMCPGFLLNPLLTKFSLSMRQEGLHQRQLEKAEENKRQ